MPNVPIMPSVVPKFGNMTKIISAVIIIAIIILLVWYFKYDGKKQCNSINPMKPTKKDKSKKSSELPEYTLEDAEIEELADEINNE